MHTLQEKLLQLASVHNLSGLTLREIGELIGEKHPQKIKHHLEQLVQKGLIELDRESGTIKRVYRSIDPSALFITIPILGSANCGPATFFADQNIQGYLKISGKLIKPSEGLFAVRAIGSSMDKANIHGKSIEDGDYVIVDSKRIDPQNKDYVLSVIDGMCNIKRFFKDNFTEQIILVSESTREIPPIVIHPEDLQYLINGKVIQVIKKPRI